MQKLLLTGIISLTLSGCFETTLSSPPLPVTPPSNHTPSVESIPKLTANIDRITTYQLKASDKDNDELNYSLLKSPDFVTISSSGLLTLKPTQEHQGTHSFMVVVSDGIVSVEASVNLTVLAEPTASCPEGSTDPECDNDEDFAPNFAPVVELTSQISAMADTGKTYQVKAIDYNDDPLIFSLENAPSWVSIDANGLMTFSPKKADVGTHNVIVVVSDGEFKVSSRLQVIVKLAMTPVDPDATNHAPVVEAIPNLSAVVNKALTYQVKATDSNNDALQYSLASEPEFVSIDKKGLITVRADSNDHAGTHVFSVVVSDGTFDIERRVQLKVSVPMTPVDPDIVNHQPTIEAIGPMLVIAGTPTSFQIKGADKDGDKLTYSTSNAPSFVSVTSSGLLKINPMSAHEGEHTFDVKVSDGFLTAMTPIKLTVELPTASCGEGSTDPECASPDDDFIVPHYNATLKSSGKIISGDVVCNGYSLAESAIFPVDGNEPFICTLGSVELGHFNQEVQGVSRLYKSESHDIAFDLTELHGNNATKVLETISACSGGQQICLHEIDSFDISEVFNQLHNNSAVEQYLQAKREEATDDVGKAPSSHRDPNLVPAVSGGSNDINSHFISSTAEASLAYKPSAEGQVLTRSQLTDANGKPLIGVNYFSVNATGLTDSNGEFEYRWGDILTFGIDTFEFGQVTGNQVNYKLTDVTDNEVIKSNIQSLVERYAGRSDGKFEITKNIHDTFAMYPNAINGLINLALPNGGKLPGADFSLPNEFEAQFNQGLVAEIDQLLRQPEAFNHLWRQPQELSLDSSQYVTESLNAIFQNVNTFHVFNDNGAFYGATGYTRGMRALNLSNRAFPVMMPRKDINREIDFGGQQAWTREGRPYIAQWPDIDMPAIPTVNKDNATFGFPFVTAGEIGRGKIVMMGNGMYPSILSCPDNYWNNRSVRIDSAAKTCTSTTVENPRHDDHGSMKQFFANMFQWFVENKPTERMNVATNIDKAYFAQHNSALGMAYDFFIDPSFGFGQVTSVTKGSFSAISASDTPILILQAYPPKLVQDGMTNQFVADLDNPNLTQDDITALIQYVNDGGNILFMDAIQSVNPEPIGRLADAAGISVGGQNVTPTDQAFCGSSYYCQSPSPNLHVKGGLEMVVLERFQDNDGKQPFTVNQDGSVEWIKDETKIKFEIPTYEVPKLTAEGIPELDAQGKPIMQTKQARIFVSSLEERKAAIAELEAAFVGTPVCNNAYEYEFNCIETRQGHGYTVRGAYHRPDFDRYEVSKDVIESMVKAANLGSNFTSLYNHELYYRTKGKQGVRLSAAELNQTYDNLSIWMWNDNPYRYEEGVQDELGFQQAVQFLNCYTDDQHQDDNEAAKCPLDLKVSLVTNDMIHGEGELKGQMNPSYPLNYMEKPLTRIMLGRSFWDHDITVDTTSYPGRTTGVITNGMVNIQTNGKGVTYSAGNNQSTGYWAPQLQEVTVTGGVRASITVMMADDLTGKPNHEVSLKRPPRMEMHYDYDGVRQTFKAPYGGLIYIKPKERDLGEVIFNLEGVEVAAWWTEGQWRHSPESSTAPIAEVDTGSFIYTTPVNNIKSIDLNKFALDMNRFADAASDFYGRDEKIEDGNHRRFTYAELKAYRHRFVNDVQISIGAAHSGYPVMNSSFNAASTNVPTNAVNDWLLWHEVGHNLASAPFNAPGSTEVTNNLLALYMQELEGRNDHPRMDRIIFDIQKAPLWLEENSGHAWSHGDAGMRLVMFGQLKLWAKSHFKIDDWYNNGDVKPDIYGTDEGWNMFKLMHRKARGDNQGDNNGINYCSSLDTGLSNGDLMMVCSSYVSGYDLSDFFTAWNVGEISTTNPDGTKVYDGGITSKGLSMLSELNLNKPQNSPIDIDSLSDGI
ncbi:SslE/AcfD family lipoprotein zinc metalloprotease [Vibrio sp. B172a]|nr:SslE/AcfD family lipoprotein zinc metalloprotease [Vibrio sp. B172a]